LYILYYHTRNVQCVTINSSTKFHGNNESSGNFGPLEFYFYGNNGSSGDFGLSMSFIRKEAFHFNDLRVNLVCRYVG